MAPPRANRGISQSPCVRGRFPRGYPQAAVPNKPLPSEAKVQARFAQNQQNFRELVAPVEVARASPQAVVCFDSRRLLQIVFTGPLEGDSRLRRDGRLRAVHRVLDAGLLLGLEQRMVVED